MKTIFAYIKGINYEHYKVWFEGNDDVIEFEKEFETYDDLINFITYFSDQYSIPVQFYI